MTDGSRRRLLVAYAAVGPLILWISYTAARYRGFFPDLAELDDLVLLIAVGSGAYCAFRTSPGEGLARVAVAFIYGLAMAFVVLYLTSGIECAFGFCGPGRHSLGMIASKPG